MSQITTPVQQSAEDYDFSPTAGLPANLPDHTQLPDKDGNFVKNYQEPPQGDLLTDCITPVLQQIHPDGQYCIGRDSGIYWRMAEPPEKGAEAPDWFYIPNVPPKLDGKIRRSYVLWQEFVAPLIALEFVSGNGAEERDKTPVKGKFWVYEQAIRIPFYGIYVARPGKFSDSDVALAERQREVSKAQVEVYQLINGRYQKMKPNNRGRYPIEPLKVELGIWQGEYQNQQWPWLRWWDAEGNLLLNSQERAQQERQRAADAEQVAQQERQRATDAEERAIDAEERAHRLAEQLRALGVEPES